MLRRAARLQKEGRYPDAKSFLASSLASLEGRERVQALSRMGLCCLAMGHPSEARKYLEEAVKLAPDDATAWLNFGRVIQELGDSMGADEALQKANELMPNRPDILYHLACYYGEKFTRAAFEAARRAALVTLEKIESPGGQEELRALGFPPELPIVLIRNLGLERGEMGSAARILNQLADRQAKPESTWVRAAALLHLGLLLANSGQYDAAINAYRLALKADSTIHPAHFNLAMTLARKQKLEDAENELKLYAEQSKGSSIVAYGYGTLEEYKGNADEAIRHYRGAMDRNEKRPVSPAVLARLDVPRDWLPKAQLFIDHITGVHKPGDFNQFVGKKSSSS